MQEEAGCLATTRAAARLSTLPIPIAYLYSRDEFLRANAATEKGYLANQYTQIEVEPEFGLLTFDTCNGNNPRNSRLSSLLHIAELILPK